MSEGGVYPWKRNSNNKAVTAPDYQRLLRPLPNPPAGLSWIYDEGAPEKWILVADTNAQAVQVVAPGQHETEISYQPDNGNGWTSATGGVATRIVPFETEAFLAAPRTTEPSAVFAQATIATASITTVSSDETNNQGTTVHGNNHDEQEEEGVAMLPKARMIVAVGTTPPPAAHMAPRTSQNASSSVSTDKTFNQKDKDKLLPDYQQEYTQHIVMPTDTLAGICLRYKMSRRELQRVNKFYGNDLRLAPCQLCIPITLKARQVGWKPQDVNSPEFKMATLLAKVPSLSTMEAKCYLETNDWDLTQAQQEAQDDAAWERQEAERQRQEALMTAAQCTRQQEGKTSDPYASHDDDDDVGKMKNDVDCFACFAFVVKALRALTRP